MSSQEFDIVNRPKHYNTHPVFRYECIDYALPMSFAAGNAFKYLYRYKFKENPAQDIRKAIYYLKHIDSYSLRGHSKAIEDSMREDVLFWFSKHAKQIDGGVHYFEHQVYLIMIDLYSHYSRESISQAITTLEKYLEFIDASK